LRRLSCRCSSIAELKRELPSVIRNLQRGGQERKIDVKS
jgi:hypothetical protein